MPMDDYSMYVPNVHYELIPIRNLVSDQEYQRNLSIRHVKKAAEHFDPYQINPVKVSRRDGINYVFNGQHTIEIIAMVSNSRETPVWCMIYDDLEYEHEADIFANQMKFVKPLLPYEIFIANLEAGSEKHLLIRDLVEQYNLKITSSACTGGICAVATLEKIYDRYGFHVLDRVLRLCIGTWEGAANSFSSNIMNGIARLINAYGDNLKDDVFKDKVGNITIKELNRTAKERKGGAMGFAEAMLIEYNKRARGTALHFDLLHTHRAPKHQYPSENTTPVEPENTDESTSQQLNIFTSSLDTENAPNQGISQ